MNYAIKTPGGYVAKYQLPPQSNRRILYTLERASARWYLTQSAATGAAKRLRVPLPFDLQHVAA